ncbi:Immunoglobulin-like domain [Trinorchestia longiramus]|nr:Immunoglobulin-like domain [Trinorchestia longiramus]
MTEQQGVKGGGAGEDDEGTESGGRSRPGEKTSVTVKEGTTVALTCHVVANPTVYNVTWFHNGKPVTGPRFGWGLRADSRLLRLRTIQRDKRGLYTCVASNDEGDGQSNAVNINVEYAPVCATGQQQEYIVPRGSPVTVSCSVEAFPSSVTFAWAKKNLAAPATRLPNIGRPEGSTGRYTVPAVYEDQLEILCWAKNIVGAQKTPCSYYIYAQGNNTTLLLYNQEIIPPCCSTIKYKFHPAALQLGNNSTLLLNNQVGRSSSELMGEDLSGNLVPSVSNFNEKTKVKGQHHPGMTVAEIGLQRNAVNKAEDTDLKEDSMPRSSVLTTLGDLVRNITSTEPFFIIGGLKGGREFAVVVSAANAEGVSPPVALSAFTLKDNAQTVIDKNGHGTLTSNFDTSGIMKKPPTDGSGGTASSGTLGRSDGERRVVIPPILLLLAGSLVAIIMVATIVIFTIKKRGQIRRRREAEQVKISDEQDYYQAHDSTEATTVLPNTDSKRKISGGSSDMHSSDSDLTRLQSQKISEDILNTDCGGPLDGRGNQDGISSDSHEMLIGPAVACEKGINIIPLGEKPSSNFDASALLASGGNSSFRVRPPLVSNDHLSHHSTKFGVPTSGILRRSCLNSTPNLATISGLSGNLDYNIAPGIERGLGTANDTDKSLGHTSLGRMPSFSKRSVPSQAATLGRSTTGFAVLEVDRLRHGSPSRLTGMTVMSTSFPSPPTLPRRSGVQFPPTPPQISPRAPLQIQYQHDGSFLQPDYNTNKIPTSISQIGRDGEALPQQQTNFTSPHQANKPAITQPKSANTSFLQDHVLPTSLSSGTTIKNNISFISNLSAVPTANYGIHGSTVTGIPATLSDLMVVGVPPPLSNTNAPITSIGNDNAPTSVRNDYPAHISSSQDAKRLQGAHIQGLSVSTVPPQDIFSSHQLRETRDKEEVDPSVERGNLSGNLRICSPSRSAMRHGTGGGPKPTVSFDIDEHVPVSQKMKSDCSENLSSL